MKAANPWQRNLTLLNAMSFSRMFMVILPIFIPLMESYGLNMKQTMLLQSAFALTSLISEVPSGYLADIVGRKFTLMLGFFISGIGFSQLIWADTFLELVIFEATLGFAFSLVSGSDMALVFESEKAIGDSARKNGISRLLSWMSFGEGASALTVFILIKYNFSVIIYAQAILGWIPFLLTIGLTEATNRTDKNTDENSIMTRITSVFIARSIIPILTGLFVVTMSFTYLVAWLNQTLWLRGELPIEVFGLIWGGYGILVGVASRYSSNVPNSIAKRPLLSWLAIILAVSYVFIASDILLLILISGGLIAVFRGLVAPFIKQRLNEEIDDQYRATVNSIVGACFKISTLILGPIMGMVVDQFNPHIAALWLIVLVAPAFLGLVWVGNRFTEKKESYSISL